MYIQILGIGGAVLLLGAFGLLELQKIQRESYVYQLLNLFGASSLSAYGFFIHGYPFFVLNAFWALLALRDTVKLMNKL
jgi:hypothetical protein